MLDKKIYILLCNVFRLQLVKVVWLCNLIFQLSACLSSIITWIEGLIKSDQYRKWINPVLCPPVLISSSPWWKLLNRAQELPICFARKNQWSECINFNFSFGISSKYRDGNFVLVTCTPHIYPSDRKRKKCRKEVVGRTPNFLFIFKNNNQIQNLF